MPDDTMDEGMDMYPSDESASNPPESIDEEEEKDSAKTILAPKSALGGKSEVGHICKVKVVADYGDEVELEYVPESETKSKDMSSDDEIDAMDQG